MSAVVAELNTDLLPNHGDFRFTADDVRVEAVLITDTIRVYRAVAKGVHPFPSYLVDKR